jgi:hypothetical protein
MKNLRGFGRRLLVTFFKVGIYGKIQNKRVEFHLNKELKSIEGPHHF